MGETVLYPSRGHFRYSGTEWRLVVEVDPELARYYRSLIPKWLPANPPRYPPHITVVRAEKEEPLHKEHWKKYDGCPVDFLYEPVLRQGKVYYWLNVACKRLEEVRLELGLPVVSPYTLPPEGFGKWFHTTIANLK